MSQMKLAETITLRTQAKKADWNVKTPLRVTGPNFLGPLLYALSDTALGGVDWLVEQAGRIGQAKTPCFETFQARTFLHIDAIYIDAFYLTGSSEDAADLVVQTYTRAFLDFPQFAEKFRRRRVSASLQTRSTLIWLYTNMHACFCEGILARYSEDEHFK